MMMMMMMMTIMVVAMVVINTLLRAKRIAPTLMYPPESISFLRRHCMATTFLRSRNIHKVISLSDLIFDLFVETCLGKVFHMHEL